MIYKKLVWLPESFDSNISHQLFEYTLIAFAKPNLMILKGKKKVKGKLVYRPFIDKKLLLGDEMVKSEHGLLTTIAYQVSV